MFSTDYSGNSLWCLLSRQRLVDGLRMSLVGLCYVLFYVSCLVDMCVVSCSSLSCLVVMCVVSCSSLSCLVVMCVV